MIDYGVFDSLFDSTVVVDQDRKILYCNEAAASLAGSSVRRLTKGVVFSDVYDLADPELFPVSGGELGRDSAAPMREIGFSIKGSGRQGKIQVTVQPFLEGAGKRWLVILHDVTLEETLHTKYQGELEEVQKAKAKLEDYSKNLEQMVEERTAEVRQANRMLSAIMDSLGQGFLVFDKQGLCSNIFTKACAEILENMPAYKAIWEVLRLVGGELNEFKMWMQAVFSEALPFESMVDLAPSLYNHSRGNHVTLNYYPIRSDDGVITNLVLVATDRTREYEAEQALLKEQLYLQMVLKAIKSRDQFGQFLSGVRNVIETFLAKLNSNPAGLDLSEAFRILHTLEGEAGLFSASTIRQASRDCQEVLEPFRRSETFDRMAMMANLNVEILKLKASYEDFLKLNHELLDILKIGQSRNVEIPVPKLLNFARALEAQNAPAPVRQLFNDQILKQPMGLYLRHLNEVAQHVAETQGKRLKAVEFDCDQAFVSPGTYDGLFASLVHSFRNAVDHGIENAELRLERGKPEQGLIQVIAREYEEQGQVWIRLQILDDGGGIDPKMIRRKLGEKFPNRDFTKQSEFDILQALFLPGFSSRESVGQFSGRGIGMDAIKTEVERLGGRVRMESTPGLGSRLILEFPSFINAELFAKSA